MLSDPRRRTVWIVDDSLIDGERARLILESEYAIELFLDGSTMLERFSDGAPDVLVLDWVLPGLSGLELCQFIRSREGSIAQVSILLLTAHHETEQVVQALDAGANDYLRKPYDDNELRARVGALMRGKAMLERVEQAEKNVRALLSNAPDALLAVDAAGMVAFANAEAERAFGDGGSLAGKRVAKLLPDLRLDTLRLGGSEALLPLPDVRVGDRIFSPTIRALPRDFAATRTISLRDVTTARHNEARRLDFYSIIAHDLRSPLSAMMLRTASMLSGRRGLLSASVTDDIRKIDGNVRSMVALINDFLDLARLEGAGYKLDREPVDVNALVRVTVDDVRLLAEESQLTVEVVLCDDRIEIPGDRRRLAQVMTNLLSNAIKFTPGGGKVTARVRLNVDAVELSVEDTGRGIDEAALPTLFERYTRVIDPQHHVAGTGLGLMIVREIVEAHGGSVSVRSKPGHGSTFSVRLPRVYSRATASSYILMADDDTDVRESLLFLLEAEGYRCIAVADGQAALDQIAAEPPCAVLLDLMMPKVIGWEVLDHVRADVRYQTLPVCIMSASVEKTTRYPGVSILEKPIAVDRLLAFVREHCAAAFLPSLEAVTAR
ncbi:MAG TPA: response regulator [Polyangia bacterium]|nr:response regulator [Polyangia bacterium]HWE31257.1 response regulator [Polyangia bacterium]